MHIQTVDDQKKSELEGLVQKWQGTCKKARRHAEACYAEAQAKASEADEATTQVSNELKTELLSNACAYRLYLQAANNNPDCLGVCCCTAPL